MSDKPAARTMYMVISEGLRSKSGFWAAPRRHRESAASGIEMVGAGTFGLRRLEVFRRFLLPISANQCVHSATTQAFHAH